MLFITSPVCVLITTFDCLRRRRVSYYVTVRCVLHVHCAYSELSKLSFIVNRTGQRVNDVIFVLTLQITQKGLLPDNCSELTLSLNIYIPPARGKGHTRRARHHLSFQLCFANIVILVSLYLCTHHVPGSPVIDPELQRGLDIHPGQVTRHPEPISVGQAAGRHSCDLWGHPGRLCDIVTLSSLLRITN